MLGFSPLASTAIADDGGIASISIQANDIVCAAPTVENSVIGQTHNLWHVVSKITFVMVNIGRFWPHTSEHRSP